MPEERRDAEEMEARLVEEGDDDLPPGLNLITERIIGAAIEVHRHLGPGWLETSYERALAREFELRGIAFERQKPVVLMYKDVEIGEGRLDFLVEGRIIIEVKAVETIAPVHRAQCIAYLRTTGHALCLLINFNCATLKDGIRRLAWTRR